MQAFLKQSSISEFQLVLGQRLELAVSTPLPDNKFAQSQQVMMLTFGRFEVNSLFTRPDYLFGNPGIAALTCKGCNQGFWCL